jgi:S1-C subfamily serine protease
MKVKFWTSLFLIIFLSSFSSKFVDELFAQEKVLESLEKSITSLIDGVKPSLVTIQGENKNLSDFYNYYYDIRPEKSASFPVSSFVGSGVVYRSDGYILTTVSVVGGMDVFQVTLADGKPVEGQVVGIDDQSNLAVIKINQSGLTPARFGNSDLVRVGSWVTAIGNSYGLPTSVSFGLVNGLRDDGSIQMSANVSPGNSGGPVLNTKGEVIGLVSAKVSEPSYIDAIRVLTEGKNEQTSLVVPPRSIELPTSGISLAIPMNEVKKTADEIIQHGTIQRGYLGVYPLNLDEKTKREKKIGYGVLVEEVVEHSPADLAGLESGDVLIEFNGKRILDVGQFRQLILDTRPKQLVQIKVLRKGSRDYVPMTVRIGKAEPIYGLSFEKFKLPYLDNSTPEVEIPYIKAWTEGNQNFLESLKSQMNELKKGKEAYQIDKRELEHLKQELKRLQEELERLEMKK